MKAVRLVFVIVFGLVLTTTAHAAKEVKIAFVDLSRIFDNYEKTKEYDGTLQKESQEYTQQREGLMNKIRDAQGKLPMLKEDEKQKLQADIDKQKADLIAFDNQKRQELAKKRDDKVREILLEIQKIVEQISKKDGYSYILNDRVLIYGDQEFNITEKVLKALNDSYPNKK